MALGLATNQVTVTTTAAQIVATRISRAAVTIVNESTTDVRIGGVDVTIGNGILLLGQKGAWITLATKAPIYAVVASGTVSVSCAEIF